MLIGLKSHVPGLLENFLLGKSCFQFNVLSSSGHSNLNSKYQTIFVLLPEFWLQIERSHPWGLRRLLFQMRSFGLDSVIVIWEIGWLEEKYFFCIWMVESSLYKIWFLSLRLGINLLLIDIELVISPSSRLRWYLYLVSIGWKAVFDWRSLRNQF